MAIPDFTMRQLLEAGVHFGHQAHRWNPKMGQYIFGTRNNIHIVDLAQSVPMLHRALQAVSDAQAEISAGAHDLAHRQLADVRGRRDVATGGLLGLHPQRQHAAHLVKGVQLHEVLPERGVADHAALARH